VTVKLRDDLGEVKLGTPCQVSWDAMKGDSRVRFCTQCNQNVYDVQNLTALEVKDILAKNEGKVCGLLFFRTDGTVITKDCEGGLEKLSRAWTDEKKRAELHFKSRWGVWIAATAALLVGGVVYMASTARRAVQPEPAVKPNPPAVPEAPPPRYPKFMGSFGQNNTY
jgi:hypothetical protein